MPLELARPALVVLISGEGRNLQAIIDAIEVGRLQADLRLVISNRRQAPGLRRAVRAGIPNQVLPATGHPDREAYDAALVRAIDAAKPDVVALAGFMRILGSAFVQHFAGKLLNIHPSLLPKHRGLDTHQRVLTAGDARHGASVHFVTDELDAGPVILQGSVGVAADDTPATLAQRVMERVETRIYPKALGWVSSGRAQMRSGRVEMDAELLEAPIHEQCD